MADLIQLLIFVNETLNYDKLKYKSNTNRISFTKQIIDSFCRSREARRRRSAGRRGSDSDMSGNHQLSILVFFFKPNFSLDLSARGGSKAGSSK